jgi:hypothetical protein
MLSFHDFDYIPEDNKDGFKLREYVMSDEDKKKWEEVKGQPVNPNSKKGDLTITTADSKTATANTIVKTETITANSDATTDDIEIETNSNPYSDPTIMAECNHCHAIYRQQDISKLIRFITRHGENDYTHCLNYTRNNKVYYSSLFSSIDCPKVIFISSP